MSLTALLDWLGGLDPVLLNAALGLLAFVENVFPPVPADVIAAFGSFVAAREGRSPVAPFLAVWLSNVGGAMFMYFIGSRLGRTRVEKWLRLTPQDPAEKRFEALYGRFGTAAFFLSRFIPGVRAIVPPFAGALHIAPFKPAVAIAIASGLWYGLITFLAFRAGASWETLVAMLRRLGWGAAIGASAILLAMLMWFYIRHKRRKAAASYR
ncbi:MAG TPA: DedA family protein [Gemmatimonadaceae bacterium]|nr:DedA family protein [Gemmatimonadaceae bacterium]